MISPFESRDLVHVMRLYIPLPVHRMIVQLFIEGPKHAPTIAKTSPVKTKCAPLTCIHLVTNLRLSHQLINPLSFPARHMSFQRVHPLRIRIVMGCTAKMSWALILNSKGPPNWVVMKVSWFEDSHFLF